MFIFGPVEAWKVYVQVPTVENFDGEPEKQVL